MFSHSVKSITVVLLLLWTIFPVSAQAELTSVDKQQITALIERWNAMLSKKENVQPETIYADQVEWYGVKMSASQVSAKVQDFCKRTSSFNKKSSIK